MPPPTAQWSRLKVVLFVAPSLVVGGVAAVFAQEELSPKDAADIPSQRIAVGGDERKLYFLIGERETSSPPANGYGLVVVLPGGDGGATFHPFVKRLHQFALPDGYLTAQAVAVKWTPDQQVVWPTAKRPVEAQQFSTEDFVRDVIEDIRKAQRRPIDATRTFTVSWSSSGPAAYSISATPGLDVAGSFIAMSVYKPELMPSAAAAAGHAYYLYHSPDDRVCPIRLARNAETELSTMGAAVAFKTYAGGHGWRGPMFEDMREGIEWLELNTPAKVGAQPSVPQPTPAPTAIAQ